MSQSKSSGAEVRQKITRIKALKTRLDAVDAEIGALVPRLEVMLGSLRLGIPIRLEMEEGPNGHPMYLAFTKVAKQWRLCVERTTDDLGQELETKPLSDVGRDERAQIFDEYLQDILDHAIEEVERRVKQREGTIRSTAEMVAAAEKVLKSDQDAEAVVAEATDAPDERLPAVLAKVAKVANMAKVAATLARANGTPADGSERRTAD